MSWMRVKPGYNPEGSSVERAAERLNPVEQSALKLALKVTRSAIPDESDAYTMYTGLANNLAMIGDRRGADQVRGIANDEARHRGILQNLLTRLEHYGEKGAR